MDAWETKSEVRIEFRKRISRVIADWVHGPVELLVGNDVRELREKFREEWGDEKRSGFRYVNWLAEVNLALGIEGDPLRALKDKTAKARVDLRGLTPEQREWFDRQDSKAGPVRVPEQVGAVNELGELFENLER